MQTPVDLGLPEQLRVLGLDGLELDGDLLARGEVRAQVDVSERARPDLPTQSVLLAHPQFHGCECCCGSGKCAGKLAVGGGGWWVLAGKLAVGNAGIFGATPFLLPRFFWLSRGESNDRGCLR